MDERPLSELNTPACRRRLGWRPRIFRSGERGQALVEFALVLPLLLILLFSLVDFGRAFYTWLVVTNAAREGARVGAVQQDQTAIVSRVNGTLGSLNPGKLTITTTNVQGPRGTPVKVNLTYDFNYATPLGSLLKLATGTSLAKPTISASASMRLE